MDDEVSNEQAGDCARPEAPEAEYVEVEVPELGEPYENAEGIEQFKRLMSSKLKSIGKEGYTGFPGCQPVSISLENLKYLQNEPYFVCEKTDGERKLLLLTQEKAFFIDRKYNFRSFDFTVPVADLDDPSGAKDSASALRVHHLTLLDGELVVSSRSSAAIPLPPGSLSFLVFDMLLLNGNSTMMFDLFHRLRLIQSHVMIPLVMKETKLPFTIALKPMYPARCTEYVWKSVVPKLPHFSDGLVYTPVSQPYVVGTAQGILKWKPPHLNTADFKLVTTYDTKKNPLYSLHAKQTAETIRYSPIVLTKEEALQYSDKGDCIVECYFERNTDPKFPESKGRFRILRSRKDKKDPNDIVIVNRILRSILDNITLETIQALYTK